MWHIIIWKLFSLTLIFTPFFNVSCTEEVKNRFANQEWANSDQDIVQNLIRQLESQAQRLAYTENVLRQTLSLMLTTPTSEPYSAVQDRLVTDDIIKSFLSSDAGLFAQHDQNEGVEKSILSRQRWKRQVNLGSSSAEDKVRAALQSAVDSSKPNQLIARSSARSAESLTDNIENMDTAQNVTNPSKGAAKDIAPSNQSLSNNTQQYAAPSARNETIVKPEDQLVTQKNLKEVVNTLQNVVKCSLAQRSDPSGKDMLGVLTNLTINLNENGKMSIQFQLKTCLKFWTAAWLNISQTSDTKWNETVPSLNASESFFYSIPKECFKKKGFIYSIEIPSNASNICSFKPLTLRECHVYHVDVQGMFLELQGTTTSLDIVFLPGNESEQTSVKAFNATASSDSLVAQWSVSSSVCAAILSSVNLTVSEDATHIDEPTVSYSYTIPRNCIQSYESEDMLFRTSLLQPSSKNISCSNVDWKPLDHCRKYRLELTPEYSSLLKGNSSSVEIFTSSNTDSYCCQLLTEETGSIHWSGPRNRGCSWLISAKKGKQIWFTLSSTNRIPCSLVKLMVYDGSYETSPVLTNFCDSGERRPSVRSRSNKLSIKLVISTEYYYNYNTVQFNGYYTTISASSAPFISGCGGYIVDTGSIYKPSFPPSDDSSSECFFYIRSSDETSTLSITSDSGRIPFPMEVYADWSQRELLNYYFAANHSTDSDENEAKLVVYSSSNRMLVKFPAWNMAERGKEFSWSILKLTKLQFDLTSDSETFESPNYPRYYGQLIDYRWVIKTDQDTKIRLTLVYMNLIEEYDYLTVYDDSGLLKEFSGKIIKPVTITSTKNDLVVRLTSSNRVHQLDGHYNDYETAGRRLGFLGAYTTVSCN